MPARSLRHSHLNGRLPLLSRMEPMKWFSLVLVVGMASAQQHCPKIEIDKSSGFCTVPDPALTPGEMDSSLACVSNTDRPRGVTNAEKDAILRAYGYPASIKRSSGEF